MGPFFGLVYMALRRNAAYLTACENMVRKKAQPARRGTSRNEPVNQRAPWPFPEALLRATSRCTAERNTPHS